MKTIEVLQLMYSCELLIELRGKTFEYNGPIGVVEATAHFGEHKLLEIKLQDGKLLLVVDLTEAQQLQRKSKEIQSDKS